VQTGNVHMAHECAPRVSVRRNGEFCGPAQQLLVSPTWSVFMLACECILGIKAVRIFTQNGGEIFNLAMLQVRAFMRVRVCVCACVACTPWLCLRVCVRACVRACFSDG
jgi:hypothetical protein